MLAAHSDAEREDAWREIQTALEHFEGDGGFEGPCELIVAAATKEAPPPAVPVR